MVIGMIQCTFFYLSNDTISKEKNLTFFWVYFKILVAILVRRHYCFEDFDSDKERAIITSRYGDKFHCYQGKKYTK